MDRLWQLDFTRNLAQGRLSEYLGVETLPLDKYIRTLGIPRMAEKYMRTIDDKNRVILENYANGINKVFEQKQVYPIEFYILSHDFRPFTPIDSVAIQYLMTLSITSDWYFELTRTRLLEVYPKEFVDKLFPFQIEHMFEFDG